MTEEPKHIVVGVWTVLRPDTRQYKQQSIEIQLEQGVAVEVPADLIYKSVTDKETGEIRDILTPAGVRYVQEQFEKLFATSEPQWDASLEQAKVKVESKNEDGWGDETDDLPTKGNAKAEPAKSATTGDDEDGWGDTSVFSDDGPTPDTETDAAWNDDDWN